MIDDLFEAERLFESGFRVCQDEEYMINKGWCAERISVSKNVWYFMRAFMIGYAFANERKGY